MEHQATVDQSVKPLTLQTNPDSLKYE